MADLGPQIVTALTALASFSAGLAVESLRHRHERRSRQQDERTALYGRYISALRQWPSNLSARVLGSEPTQEINARLRQHEELVGPVRLHANEEIRMALEDLQSVGDGMYQEFLALVEAGMDPPEAAARAWGTHERHAVERLEQAMRNHLDLEPSPWWHRKRRRSR